MPAHGSQLCMRHKFSTAWGGPGTIMGLNMHATIALPALPGEASESALSQHQGVVGWVENVRCGMSSVRSRRADAPAMSNAAVSGRSGIAVWVSGEVGNGPALGAKRWRTA